jgi:hypothetical protein
MNAAQAKQEKTSAQKSQKTRRQPLTSISQNQPSSTKRPRTIVPPPQSARIMERYVGGDSIRQIAREEQRDRATVTKIVRSDEMNAVVQKMRERYYGLGLDALDAVQHTLQVGKDGRLGRQLLVDIGVAPSPLERYAAATQPIAIDYSEMTAFEVAMTENEEGQMKRIAYGCACALEASAEAFGTPLQTPDEIRHDRKVVAAAEEITGGRFLEICDEGGPEEKRVRQLAEQKVKREESRLLLPPRRAQRALPHKKQAAIVGQVSTRS